MSNTTTSETLVHSAGRHQERARMRARAESHDCACCGSHIEVVRAARFGHVPFCQSCLDRTLHPGMWDELGEAGD
jgi:hypothetical protein